MNKSLLNNYIFEYLAFLIYDSSISKIKPNKLLILICIVFYIVNTYSKFNTLSTEFNVFVYVEFSIKSH